jgi:acetyl-CoA C-acetyltransferase
MVCGSGLKAVMLAAQAIQAGDANLIVAGGMESMSNAPFLLPGVRKGYKYGNQNTVDALIRDGLWCVFEDWPMGEAAEHIAAKYAVTRSEQDRFSAQSHQRAAQAWDRGAFAAEVVRPNS